MCLPLQARRAVRENPEFSNGVKLAAPIALPQIGSCWRIMTPWDFSFVSPGACLTRYICVWGLIYSGFKAEHPGAGLLSLLHGGRL